MGPGLIFDKSVLQALNPSECLWLDSLYTCNITPLFYVETLADLAKSKGRASSGARPEKTPADIVSELAGKTPQLHQVSNVFHQTLLLNELLYNRQITMDTRPFPGNGRPVESGGGKGVIIESPEADAMDRWHRGDFEAIEREYARHWRNTIGAIDLQARAAEFKQVVRPFQKPSSPEAALHIAKQLLHDPIHAQWNFMSILNGQGLEREHWEAAARRWQGSGYPPLPYYAKYAAHVRLVDLYFFVLLSSDLIQKKPFRPSNMVDISYLYYLPFCEVFVSGDNLHRLMGPDLCEQNQTFLTKDELKADLQKLHSYFAGLPEDVRARGAFKFASLPPASDEYLTTRLWDKYRPRWRPKPAQPKVLTAEKEAEVAKVEAAVLAWVQKQINKAEAAETLVASIKEENDESEPDFIHIKRPMPSHIAGWALFSEEEMKKFGKSGS